MPIGSLSFRRDGIKVSKPRVSSMGTTWRNGNVGMRSEDCGTANVGAVVVTLIDDVTGVTPSAGVTEAGVGVQVTVAGAPVQVSATAELKPPTGVTVAVTLPGLPCVRVNVAAAVSVKSGVVTATPLPLSATVCGLVESLSVKTSEAVSAEATEGSKVTLTVQLAPAAKVPAAQVLAEVMA
jgi:hypothetical protein